VSKTDAREALRAMFVDGAPRYSWRVGRLTGWSPVWVIGSSPRDVPEREREQLAGLLSPADSVIVTVMPQPNCTRVR
jgi:hypothetical protein